MALAGDQMNEVEQLLIDGSDRVNESARDPCRRGEWRMASSSGVRGCEDGGVSKVGGRGRDGEYGGCGGCGGSRLMLLLISERFELVAGCLGLDRQLIGCR